MKSVQLIAGMMLAALPCASALADGLSSRNYVEVGVARQHDDIASAFGRDANADGAYLRGSAAFGDSGAYGFGGVQQGRSHAPFGSVDVSRGELGVGYARGVAPGVELLGEASYVRETFAGWSAESPRLAAGVRTQLGARGEGWAKARYTDRPFDSSRYSAELGGLLKLSDRWGLTGGVEVGEDRRDYTLGVRASF